MRLRRSAHRNAATTARVVAGALIAGASLVASPANAAGTSAGLTKLAFNCVFTEPFSALVVSAEEVSWAPNIADLDIPTAVTSATVKSVGKGLRIDAVTAQKSKLGVSVSFGKNSGGVGEYTTDYEAKIDGRVDTGMCVKYPDGSVPRRVVGVADNDTLNIRQAGKATSPAVTTVGPGELVFLLPGSPKAGWVRVAASLFPKSGTGRVAAVTGWAKASFLGPVR